MQLLGAQNGILKEHLGAVDRERPQNHYHQELQPWTPTKPPVNGLCQLCQKGWFKPGHYRRAQKTRQKHA